MRMPELRGAACCTFLCGLLTVTAQTVPSGTASASPDGSVRAASSPLTSLSPPTEPGSGAPRVSANEPMEGAAPSSVAAPESLLIGPGDLLRITVLRESELDQRVRVLDSGEITLALAGHLPIQGLTPAQAAARIADKYRDGKFLVNPEVSVL